MSEAAAPDSNSESKPKKKLLFIIAPVLLVVLLLSAGGFFYFRGSTASAEENSKQAKGAKTKDKKKAHAKDEDEDEADSQAEADAEHGDAKAKNSKDQTDEKDQADEKSTDGKKSADNKKAAAESGKDKAEDADHSSTDNESDAPKQSSAAALKASLKSALPDDEEVKQVVELQPFVVNLADAEQSRYLRLTVSVGIGGEDGGEAKPEPLFITRVRNAMLAVLSVKKSDDVLTVAGKKQLRKELLKAAQAASHHPEVLAIYITDFIVQL